MTLFKNGKYFGNLSHDSSKLFQLCSYQFCFSLIVSLNIVLMVLLDSTRIQSSQSASTRYQSQSSAVKSIRIMSKTSQPVKASPTPKNTSTENKSRVVINNNTKVSETLSA